jgi:hypothetical protein
MIVRSNLPCPVELRLFGRQVGLSSAVLQPGGDVVDTDFWRAWSEQHKNGLAGHFTIVEGPPRPL